MWLMAEVSEQKHSSLICDVYYNIVTCFIKIITIWMQILTLNLETYISNWQT